jgi:hypothetical protein
MMTRKDYVSTAEILSTYANEIPQTTFEDLVADFADMFLADNPRFSLDKFEEACYKQLDEELN